MRYERSTLWCPCQRGMAIQCILMSHVIEVPKYKCFRGYVVFSRTKEVEKKSQNLSVASISHPGVRIGTNMRFRVYHEVFRKVAPGLRRDNSIFHNMAERLLSEKGANSSQLQTITTFLRSMKSTWTNLGQTRSRSLSVNRHGISFLYKTIL